MNSFSVSELLLEFCEKYSIDANSFSKNYQNCYQTLIEQLLEQVSNGNSGRPLIVGLSAPQGAGKTTLVEFFKLVIEKQHNLKVLTLSLDDFYKTRTDRLVMVNQVHPLFITRGVPGTHDIKLALSTLTALKNWKNGSNINVPWFDKAIDDRGEDSQNQAVTSPVDIILFEGWCLNAKPQPAQALRYPINELEEKYDPQAIWRTYVNSELAGNYQELFKLIDYSITFYPPSFETVCLWRHQQELQLINWLNKQKLTTNSTMNTEKLAQFMMHFERISRHMYIDSLQKANQCDHNIQRIRLDKNRNTTLI